MLTPAKIKNHHFEASGRNAYKIESVDAFFEEVSVSYEQMFQENGEMFKKLNLLAERLEEYKKDEDNIRNALLTAQRMAEKITNEAREKADTLIAEVTERTQTEHARLDAAASEIIVKAQTQAQAIIDDAQFQAAKIIDDATKDAKEAAVNAHSAMIKEEALLETMKAEVTKFKKNIVEQYTAQFELIDKLPEFIYARFEEQEKVEEVEEVEEEAEPETYSAPEEAQDFDTEPEAVAAVSDNVITEEEAEDADTVENNVINDDISVDTLQQMIDEGEDTDADDEINETEEAVVVDDTDDAAELVLPSIDEETPEEINEIVENYDYNQTTPPDIPFTKPRRPQENAGFKVNVENINSYSEPKNENFDNYLDEFDDDDEDNDLNEDGGKFSDKLKGFFKK